MKTEQKKQPSALVSAGVVFLVLGLALGLITASTGDLVPGAGILAGIGVLLAGLGWVNGRSSS